MSQTWDTPAPTPTPSLRPLRFSKLPTGPPYPGNPQWKSYPLEVLHLASGAVSISKLARVSPRSLQAWLLAPSLLQAWLPLGSCTGPQPHLLWSFQDWQDWPWCAPLWANPIYTKYKPETHYATVCWLLGCAHIIQPPRSPSFFYLFCWDFYFVLG